ncbi:MAG: thiamine phosphate synthase [Bacteroidales bacterium]|nr:thiamine phosphate synthase [Bacteroidales bacterium]
MRRLIGITPQENVFREQERISAMIRSGKVEYFHIRKPDFNENQMREYLSKFDADVRLHLSLHDYHGLAKEMGIGGIHLNGRNPNPPDGFSGRISQSCHSIDEVVQCKDKVDYCFLSPIFDSISKQGYTSKFSLQELKKLSDEKILDEKVCALSGVTFDNIAQLEKIGFSSFAMLSSLWELPRTMFISHHNAKYDYISGCKEALRGGIRFVQLRMKDASDDEVVATAKVLREECDKYAALLTVDDRVNLLETGLFDGVHIGKNDMLVCEAKKITGDKFLLGATCNTEEDVFHAIADGADYIGMGPFRFTTTKKNLSAILGLNGYRNIMQKMQALGAKMPIYAIGGIRVEDLQDLKDTGVHGIAISSVILDSENPNNTIKQILKTF